MQRSLYQYRFNGDTSWNDALHRCLKDCPASTWDGRTSDRPAVGTEILLWGLQEPCVLNDFELPWNKLVKFTSPSRCGSVIRSDTGTAFIINNDAGKLAFSYKGFYGILFDNCGVKIASQARGQYNFDECYFDSAPDWAVQGGEGTTGVNFWRTYFNRCNGSVGVLGRDADFWRLRDCHFLHSGGNRPAVLSQSSGVTIDSCQFENRASKGVKAYVQIAPADDPKLFAGGWNSVTNNRFGGEPGWKSPVYECFGPPPAMVLLGPDAETTGTMSGLRIANNWFKAPQGTAEPAYYGIVANKSVNQSQFHGNQFLHSYSAAVKINNALGLFALSNTQDNEWYGNTYDSKTKPFPWLALDKSTAPYNKLNPNKPFMVA